MSASETLYVSRAGMKLHAALETFSFLPAGCIAADLGCNVGGFTDCLLKAGATKVYAVDTSYGVLAWKLRQDPRVVVMERTNALHCRLPEPVNVVVIDVAWTRQDLILPVAKRMLVPGGDIITLSKPHYECALAKKQKGVLTPVQSEATMNSFIATLPQHGYTLRGHIKSPLQGQGGNSEYVLWLKPQG